jgi:hypothetical protein
MFFVSSRFLYCIFLGCRSTVEFVLGRVSDPPLYPPLPFEHTDMSVIQNQGPQARSLRTLRKWIADGKLAAGEPLPTEHSLMELLKVSRTTVRAALSQLEAEGLIHRVKTVAAGCASPLAPSPIFWPARSDY